jgi:hypothetical protein
MQTAPTPAIAKGGYRLTTVQHFLTVAPDALIERYRRDCAGHGDFIIWDALDDADGLMICAESVEQLNREFLEYFGEDA